jgi:hypothetical protein
LVVVVGVAAIALVIGIVDLGLMSLFNMLAKYIDFGI